MVLFVFTWFITYGTWGLFEPQEPLNHYYFADLYHNAMAQRLRQGRLNVPLWAIEYEAFVREGRWYGYWGITPALLRLPLNGLFPSLKWSWNRPFMVAGCVVNLLTAWLILRLARRLIFPKKPLTWSDQILYAVFILLAGLGSTNIFLASSSWVYHESIMWGSAFALLSYYFLLKHAMAAGVGNLLGAGLFCILSVHSRSTVGVGTVLSLLVAAGLALRMFVRRQRSGRGVARREEVRRSRPVGTLSPLWWGGIAGLAVVLAVASSLWINYLKFRSFSGLPHHLYVCWAWAGEHEKYQRFQGKALHWNNLRTTTYNYFAPQKLSFSSFFPWVRLTLQPTRFPESEMEWMEFGSIPVTKPALLLLSFLGVAAARMGPRGAHAFRVPLLGAAAGAFSTLFFMYVTERYIHDWYPFFILASALGLHWLMSWKNAVLRRSISVLFIGLAIAGVLMQLLFTLAYQREEAWKPCDHRWGQSKLTEYQEWCATVDRLLSAE